MQKIAYLTLLVLMSIILASTIAFGMDIAQKKDILAAHNRYRAEVIVTPLA